MSQDFPAKPPHPSTLESIDLSELDPRLVLDKASQRWLFEEGDQEYEYDYIKEQWVNTSKRSLSEDDMNKEDIKRQRKQDMSKLKEELNSLKQKKRTAVYLYQIYQSILGFRKSRKHFQSMVKYLLEKMKTSNKDVH